MKSTSKLILFVLTFLALAASVYAQSPREQLNQMVEQLQKTPTDNALRERIIKLGSEIKPAPAIPEEAEHRMARGEAAFERAKDPSDYTNAVREFQAAATAAPWFATPYFNLGVAEEKADHPKEAMESFRWYLLAAPNAKDAADVRKRLFKLEYAAEQQGQAATVNAKQAVIRAQEERFEGTWQRSSRGGDGSLIVVRLHVKHRPGDSWSSLASSNDGEQHPYHGMRDIQLVGSELRFIIEETLKNAVCGTYEVRGAVSSDGLGLSLAYTLKPLDPNRPLFCPLAEYYGSHVEKYTKQ